MFVDNKACTNLPRKFNVTIAAYKKPCTHAETQEIALTPNQIMSKIWVL